jgi:hypothetical protein
MRVHPDVRAVLQAIKATTPPTPSEFLYHTQNTNFGAYLIAANRLRYRGARLAANQADVDLLFDDPQCEGPDLLRRFNVGAIEQVNARVLFETRGYLLSEVKRTLKVGVANAAK